MKTNKLNFTILFCLFSCLIFSQKMGDMVKVTVPIKVIDIELITFIKGDSLNENNVLLETLIETKKQKIPYLEEGYFFKVVDIGKDSVRLMANAFKKPAENENSIEKLDKIEEFENSIFVVNTSDFLQF